LNTNFSEAIEQLHDARFFGFLYDNDREKFRSNFYIYVQLFVDFEEPSYGLKKALVRFDNARIDTFSIKSDPSQGQFFITNINFIPKEKGLYRFEFSFSSDDVELSLYAGGIEVISSEKLEWASDQYLETDWLALLD
jgi:hypothetical protein